MPTASSNNSDVVTAPSGAFFVAKANARSGNIAISDPKMITPNPNQIQLMSGLTTTCSVAVCCSAL